MAHDLPWDDLVDRLTELARAPAPLRTHVTLRMWPELGAEYVLAYVEDKLDRFRVEHHRDRLVLAVDTTSITVSRADFRGAVEEEEPHEVSVAIRCRGGVAVDLDFEYAERDRS